MARRRGSWGSAKATFTATALLAAAGLMLGVACGRTAPRLTGWSGNPGGYGGTGGEQPGGTGGGGHGHGGGGQGGGGAPPGCQIPSDCDDHNSCTTDKCVDGFCQNYPKDDDGDNHVDALCGGDDCNDLNPNAYPGHPEVCSDGADNDCNGVADCFDPACFNVPNCGCVPSPGGENCTNGVDDDCDGAVDCNDTDCMGTPACGCLPSEAGHCDNGFDDDCDDLIDCADPDCYADPICGCVGMPEDCSNGVDDNCDGKIDCADPLCTGIWPCACQPPGSPEVCNDGQDNDCDGKIDCADPDCVSSSYCQHCTAEICNDGLDNNCNNLIDCADPECYFDPACTPVAEICNNGKDDDHDLLVDCADPDCANNPYCQQHQSNCLTARLITGSGSYYGDTTGNVGDNYGSCSGLQSPAPGEAVFYFILNQPSHVRLDTIGTPFPPPMDSILYVRAGSCKDGVELGCDDDSGGNWAAMLDFTILYPGTYYVFVDGYTVDPQMGPNEGPFQLNVTITPNPQEICNDGIDNDGDHYVDCADPDCVNAPNCHLCNGGQPPGPEFGPDACTDGRDNDCDGLTDCDDPDCHASAYYLTECCNGVDDNGNGIVDDWSCRCASDADCGSFGELCYTHTVWACGLPCNSFFGNICHTVAPGSYCNEATLQCEF